ncbi:sugar phosphate isomerase/epimerase [Bradyrhizobium japonicum]|uniref:sugar phosphate isomerase/epimerase family protein n=1 Tax=Bradyrhizobium japonicum TaxID=375 RepID=UPI0005769BA5|nr:sugar phosphate isomerase/epimerase [Bradyrhizobium japonicum]MBR0733985.1 sugar phosphate isomerase/epimerase [Bradyrhizobium japonicum]MBR0808692.1 sugar phosphate isomerase/epimerase [Bradyrhizobium japonicum]
MRLGPGSPKGSINRGVALSRRNVLQCLAAGMAMGAASVSASEKRKIGLQLYTLRDLLKNDFEGTLRNVARFGYSEVEFAGILGPDVRRTGELLRSLGLGAPSLHLEYGNLRDKTGSSFDLAHSLGSRFVVCPWLDPPQRQTIDDWKRICDELNRIGELAARAGLTLAYHNHDFEFADLTGGILPYDVLLSRTDERFVKFELDVYWAARGNLDSARVLRAHPSRFRLLHLKDMATDGSTTELGRGTIDFAGILDAAFESGVQHVFVEQDISAEPLRSIEISIAFLRRQPHFAQGR